MNPLATQMKHKESPILFGDQLEPQGPSASVLNGRHEVSGQEGVLGQGAALQARLLSVEQPAEQRACPFLLWNVVCTLPLLSLDPVQKLYSCLNRDS